MTNMQGTVAPGWYSDPTGMHQLRYFDGRWTDHVSNNGVHSVSPMPPAPSFVPAAPINSPAPNRRNRRKVAWTVAGVAAVGVVVIVVSVAATSSSGSGKTGGSNLSSFCDDFSGTWSIVEGGVIAADTLVARVQTDPTYTQADTDETNRVTQGAQDAGVLANESPSSVKDTIVGIHNYLLIVVKIAQGNVSAVHQIKDDNTVLEDAATLSASVPITTCGTH